MSYFAKISLSDIEESQEALRAFDDTRQDMSVKVRDAYARIRDMIDDWRKRADDGVERCAGLSESVSSRISELSDELSDAEQELESTSETFIKKSGKEVPNPDYVRLEKKIRYIQNKISRLESFARRVATMSDESNELATRWSDLQARLDAVFDDEMARSQGNLRIEWVHIESDILKKVYEIVEKYMSLKFDILPAASFRDNFFSSGFHRTEYEKDDFGTEIFDEDGWHKPNQAYTLNGFKYKTDHLGRIVSASGIAALSNPIERERSRYNDKVRVAGGDWEEGKDSYGHLIARQFGGADSFANMVAQAGNTVNQGEYFKFEEYVAAKVKSGLDVKMTVSVLYKGDSNRPYAFVTKCEYSGGDPYVRFICNT